LGLGKTARDAPLVALAPPVSSCRGGAASLSASTDAAVRPADLSLAPLPWWIPQ
jgi:hypothetical protein